MEFQNNNTAVYLKCLNRTFFKCTYNCQDSMQHTHTHTQICISGQWVCRKGFSNEEGFQGRFETNDRGRMTDRNRELVPNSWDLVRKIANFVLMGRIWQPFLSSGYHCSILNCLVWCCCPPPPPPVKLDNSSVFVPVCTKLCRMIKEVIEYFTT